jgi:amino acid transporter
VPDNELTLTDPADASDLHEFGYNQSLRRTMGPLQSFSIAFSMISITTAVFFLLPSLFTSSGGVGIWLWFPCALGVFLIVLVYAHLAARIPLTGFAYQWNSRLVNGHFGWFTGWSALLAFFAGTAQIAFVLAAVFASDVWDHPTHGDLVLFALVMIAIAAVINIISNRLVNAVNTVGVGFEFFGSVVVAAILLVGAIFFFHHSSGFHILTSSQTVGGSSSTFYGLALAALLPFTTFLGWEGAADLAEETTDPRSVTPKAMIRANYVSVAASFFMIVGFVVAIPHGVPNLVNQPDNALIYIFRSHFGSFASDILQAVVFIAIFSCLLANMVVATRLTFSMSRDGMLPASSLLKRVNVHTRTPIASIVLVALVAGGINMMSAGITSNIIAIPAVSYYLVYVVTVAASLYAYYRNRLPSPRPGDFSLGRAFPVVAAVALLWALAVVLDIAIPHGGHTAVKYMLGAQALGVIWYLAYLRPRISDSRVGVGKERPGEPSRTSSFAAAPNPVGTSSDVA